MTIYLIKRNYGSSNDNFYAKPVDAMKTVSKVL
jgi:hypothetical protein